MANTPSSEKKSTGDKAPRTIRFDSKEQVRDLKKAARRGRQSFNAFIVAAAEEKAATIKSPSSAK